MRMSVSILVASIVVSAGVVTFAGERPDDQAAKAYANGKAAFDAERFIESADSFREAYELKPAWKILYNIGQAEAAAKRYGFALEAFERYMAEGGDDVEAERQEMVMTEIARLRNLVGYIRVTAPSGLMVSVDGVKSGIAPISREIPVAATVNHSVSATRDGKVVDEKSVQVGGGRTVKVELAPEVTQAPDPSQGSETMIHTEPAAEESAAKEPAVKESATKEPAKKMSPLKLWGWIATGVGGAVLIGGIVTGGMALSKDGDLADDCSGHVCPEGYDFSVEKKRDKLALATDILIPTGAVIAAAGIVMVVIDAVRRDDERTDATVWVHPMLAPNNAGLALEGRF